ncbi:MAG: TonB-dependent receptor domain-containing protein, partial [Marinilabilia sp.]
KTLQHIFDDWTMETSDNIDLGLRYNSEMAVIAPSFFYARHYDVLASVYDPEIEIDYYQNAGELTAYGADVEIYLNPLETLTLLFNPAWNKMTYNQDMVQGDETIAIEGNQAPATPEFSFKTGAIFSMRGWETSLRVKHNGKRYGDATNKEEIDGYTVTDLSVSYNKDPFNILKSFEASLEIKNLFDTKYVGAINAQDDARQGNTSYYAGSPRSIIGTVAVKF